VLCAFLVRFVVKKSFSTVPKKETHPGWHCFLFSGILLTFICLKFDKRYFVFCW